MPGVLLQPSLDICAWRFLWVVKSRYIWHRECFDECTLSGSIRDSPIAYIFFLTLAGGRKQVDNNTVMLGMFVDPLAGFLTDLPVTLART